MEDEPLIRLAIVDELTDLGFDVFEAANARDALNEMVQNPGIQVMFTDIDMPGEIDGLRLAMLVRGRWPSVHIIVTSGKRSFEHHDLPVVGYFIAKPYDPAQVAARITEAIEH